VSSRDRPRSVSEISRPLALARLYGEAVNLGYLSANLWEKVSFDESLEGNSMSSDEGDSLAEKYLSNLLKKVSFLPNLWKEGSFANLNQRYFACMEISFIVEIAFS
jgi:hypothetical protein